MLLQKTTRLLVFALLATLVGTSSASAQLSIPNKFNFSRVQQPKAFDHFDGEDEGTSVENRYLLSHLSMHIYNTSNVSNADFEEHLQIYYGNHGVNDVQLFHDSSSGADGAIFVTDDAVIVCFRGTATEDGWNLADQFADLDNRVKLVKVNEKEIGVHQGFWEAADSVYSEILMRVVVEMAQGRKLWLTGHSLGGAMASVTAFRMQYISGLPVQGVITYGAPRVGNAEFYKVAEGSAAGSLPLTLTTQRFVLQGDPAPTFWNTGWDYKKRKHTYHHFGITHNIYDMGTWYDFKYDTGELAMASIPWQEIYSRLSTGIHMDYEDALYAETAEILLDLGKTGTLNSFSALPQN